MGKAFRVAFLALLMLLPRTASAGGGLKLLAATFPVRQIAANIIEGRQGVTLSLMIPSSMGCPHDYALTPADMRKLSAADVLLVNGLGLEEFLGAPVRSANPALRVVSASEGLTGLLDYAEEERGEVNPHIFASPAMAAKMGEVLARGLSEVDPEGASLYRKNAEGYAVRMKALAEKFAGLGAGVRNSRIVTQHGVFDYLARDAGLVVTASIDAHGGASPSAAAMKRLLEFLRRERPGALFTEPQYPSSVGEKIAKEAGIPSAMLDPVASGPVDAPLDYYDKVMAANLETLWRVLGKR